MSGPITEVLSEDLKDLRAEVHRIDINLAEIRTEIRMVLRLFKWVAVSVSGGAIAAVISTAGWGLSITSQVQGLRYDMSAIRNDMDKLSLESQKTRLDMDKLSNNVDKLRLDSEKTQLDLERLRIDVEKIRVAVTPAEVRKAVHETQPPAKWSHFTIGCRVWRSKSTFSRI